MCIQVCLEFKPEKRDVFLSQIKTFVLLSRADVGLQECHSSPIASGNWKSHRTDPRQCGRSINNHPLFIQGKETENPGHPEKCQGCYCGKDFF